MRNTSVLCAACIILAAVLPSAAQEEKGTILEEVVARVNAEAITLTDYDRAKAQLENEDKQDCTGCTPEQLNEKIGADEKNLLRDLIDQSLLVQRAKDLGVSVDADVVKRLDQIRQQNNLASMDDLEKAVDSTGQDFEDFKNQIERQLLQQEVIQREVSSKIKIDHADVLKYYDEHKAEFVRPEQVVLREIFVSTKGKSPDEIPALRQRAEGLLQRVKDGDDFGEIAKHFSDASTAKNGGELGTFERNQLNPAIADAVFKLDRNGLTDVIEARNGTDTGFEIYQVEQHYPAGIQPEEKVDSEIEEKLYQDQMKPALRDYENTLRQDSYVEVKPGYEDTAGVKSTSIEEVAAAPDDNGKKSKKKSDIGQDPL